jgi:putative ABC transport system permease protein
MDVPVVYTPSGVNAKGENEFGISGAMGIARLRPGVSLQQAQAEARSVFAHNDPGGAKQGSRIVLESYAKYLTGDTHSALLALLGGVVVLFLIATANFANLQIARAMGRITEMQVRSALGASFRRLLQQVVTESLIVSLAGPVLGGALTTELVHVTRSAYGEQFSRFDELAVHPEVFGACALLAILAGLLAAVAPMLRIRRQAVVEATRAVRSTRRSRVPGMLVALQVALTCVLLVTSGLFVQTFRALEDVKLGFDPQHVTTLVLMPENQRKDPETSRQTIAALLEKFNAMPGIQAATMQSAVPFSGFNFIINIRTDVSGRVYRSGDSSLYSMVSSNFVRASGVRLLRGRGFAPADDGSGAMVAVINEAFAKQFLGGRDPIGASVQVHRDAGDKDANRPFMQPLTVVGEVENELQGGDLGAPLYPMVYLDYRQLPKASPLTRLFSVENEFAIRSMLPQGTLDNELRTAVKHVAPDMVEMNLTPMEQAIANSLNQRRLALRLLAGFGGVALLLAAVGIYGVLAYSVAQRRKEIGIRMALGSSRAEAMGLVVRHAGRMLAWGLGLGTLAAWPAARAVKAFLFGVKALDPVTLCAVTLMLLLVCAVAATLPASRAARVDPMEALRTE